MTSISRRTMLTVCGAAILSSTARAESYPVRPVKVVVPYPAGGSNDIIARVLAQKLGEREGQSFFVENRAGASGNIGAEVVATAAADGYTLLVTAPPPLSTNVALYKSLPFDPATAFAPVALLATVPIVLMVHPSLPARNVQELIALAKAKPGTLNFGSSGIGSTNHLAGELLKSMTGIDIVHVPYKGAAPAMNDLIAGHIPMMFDNMPGVLAQVKGGAVRAIAVAGAKRATALADVPTVSESGVPGFEAFSWFGSVAPAKTPAGVLEQLESDIAAILATPEMKTRLADLGAEPGTVTGAAFGQFLAADTAKWTKVIQISGATTE
jgi:tripartite-type tricarboxylate transporter receptor subunit TctC